MTDQEKTDIIKIETFIPGGLIGQLEFKALKHIANYYHLPLITKEDLYYAYTVKVVYEGWLIKLYELGNTIDDPESKAYELTTMTLGMFGGNKQIGDIKPKIEEGEK